MLLLAALLPLVISAAPTPFPPDVYRERREKVLASLKGCAAVLYSRTGKPGVRSIGGEVDSQFYWLTGVDEPGAVVFLAPSEPVRRHVLYLDRRDPEDERWTGPREPLRPALRRQLGFDHVGRTWAVHRDLFEVLRHATCVARIDFDTAADAPEKKLLGEIMSAFDLPPVRSAWAPVERLRAVKEQREIARMERAFAITLQGHAAAVAAMKPGASERDITRALLAAFASAGAIQPAFKPIVGTGADGTIVHWQPRDVAVAKDDVVLIDAAAAFEDYAADVTRTYPVSGRFTPEQRGVYDAVLAAQDAALRAVKPGNSLMDVHRAAEQTIIDAGYQDGLLHLIGHFIGLEVSDPGDRTAPLEPGMVITVEPGIYLPERRIGVRVEDVVVVTTTGYRSLTAEFPRTADEVERFVARIRSK